jgi:phenylalanyl-tRNA synthetase beta chain
MARKADAARRSSLSPAVTREKVSSAGLEAPAQCPRFAGRVIQGVNPAARTPLWMRERLRRAGCGPIRPVVDVTNYVMLELGQPLHAYDMRRLRAEIAVRNASAGEKLLLLDGPRDRAGPVRARDCGRGRALWALPA